MIRVDETDPVGEIEPSFPYRDVTVRRGVDFKDNYDIQSEIGRGKFGTVYHCKEKTTGLQLAAKVVTTTRKEDRRAVEREVEIMRRLQHPRLIQLYDAIDTGKQIYVILELIQGGELFERVIDDDFVLTERSCAVFMRQICEGIEFVHAQHILHLDMKPENILCLTKEGNRIKIIDFGLARNYDPRKKLQVLFGTPEFVAPEVVNFDQIGFGTDMWSIGVICYVLLSGLSPFMGDTDVETMANVTIAKYDFDHDAFTDISEDAKDFIRCLLVKDKEKRATATECRSHSWLSLKSSPPKKIVVEEPAPTLQTKPESPKAKKKKKKNRQHPEEPKAVAPSSLGATSSSGNCNTKDELDVTKDNLRMFVERWREHPDSPYAIEQDADEESSRWREPDKDVNQRFDNNFERISLGGQSPSPCGSVCSSPSEISGWPGEKTNNALTVPKNVVLGLERRASEGYAAMAGHRRDQAAQIVLAEEIIKLSEHLRNLAMGQSGPKPMDEKLSGNNIKSGTNGTNGATRKIDKSQINLNNNDNYRRFDGKNDEKTNGIISIDKSSSTMKNNITSEEIGFNGNNKKECNEISEKLSSLTNQRKLNGTTFNGNRSYDKRDVTSFSLNKSSSSSRTKQFSSDGNYLFDEPGGSVELRRNNETSTDPRSSFGDCQSRVTWRPDNFDDNDAITINSEIDLTPPWRRARVKHRFGETCRDVPRISNLRDIHKSLNLDEPKSTKDLLLHLLGEWDDSTRPGGIGRKSVSVDWCGEESVARRSMNSLAEYFQSEQQKTTTTGVTTNASSASIHR